MNWSVLRLLFVHEIKMLLRARRTVILAVVLPAVVMPLMIYAQKYSADRRERQLTSTTYRFAISGPLAERLRGLITKARESLSATDDQEFDRLRQFKFIEIDATNPRESLDKNEIDFYIETFTGEQADKLPTKPDTSNRQSNASRNNSSTVRRLGGVPL